MLDFLNFSSVAFVLFLLRTIQMPLYVRPLFGKMFG